MSHAWGRKRATFAIAGCARGRRAGCLSHSSTSRPRHFVRSVSQTGISLPPIAHRPFCTQCGTPLGLAFLDSENIDITVGSLDDPYSIVPTKNFGIERKHAVWEDTSHLPGQRVDEWEPTASRWKKAIGKIPDQEFGEQRDHICLGESLDQLFIIAPENERPLSTPLMLIVPKRCVPEGSHPYSSIEGLKLGR